MLLAGELLQEAALLDEVSKSTMAGVLGRGATQRESTGRQRCGCGGGCLGAATLVGRGRKSALGAVEVEEEATKVARRRIRRLLCGG